MAGDPKNLVQSAAKAFAVLKAFDAEAPELTITEVAGRAGLDRGTAFRLIHTLNGLGYLAAVPNSRRFRLTLKCLELGYTVLARGDLKTHARPPLKAVVPDIADAASLGMLDGPDVVYIERVQGNLGRADIDRRIGSRIGAYASALGHAMLAYLPRQEQIAALEASERVKLSERTLVDLDALLERLALVRERGYAIADGENAYGLRTAAAPVLDPEGAPIASVSLTVRSERLELDTFLASAVPEALRMTNELSQAVRLSFGAVAQTSRQHNIG
jgi:DNA-binding IclR family transcriptional regulator